MKKEPKFGFSLSPLLSSGMDPLHTIPRSLLPPLPVPPPGPHPPPHHLLTADTDLKFPRSLFPPFPYPLYPLHHAAKLHAEDLASTSGGGKTAADLALQALYGSSLYSHAAAAAAAATWPNGLGAGGPCMVPCSCGPAVPTAATDPTPRSPTPSDASIKRPVAYLLVKPEDHYASSATSSPHVIWRPLPVLPDSARGNLGGLLAAGADCGAAMGWWGLHGQLPSTSAAAPVVSGTKEDQEERPSSTSSSQ